MYELGIGAGIAADSSRISQGIHKITGGFPGQGGALMPGKIVYHKIGSRKVGIIELCEHTIRQQRLYFIGDHTGNIIVGEPGEQERW